MEDAEARRRERRRQRVLGNASSRLLRIQKKAVSDDTLTDEEVDLTKKELNDDSKVIPEATVPHVAGEVLASEPGHHSKASTQPLPYARKHPVKQQITTPRSPTSSTPTDTKPSSSSFRLILIVFVAVASYLCVSVMDLTIQASLGGREFYFGHFLVAFCTMEAVLLVQSGKAATHNALGFAPRLLMQACRVSMVTIGRIEFLVQIASVVAIDFIYFVLAVALLSSFSAAVVKLL